MGIATPGVGSDTDQPAGGASGSHLPFSWPRPPHLGNEGGVPQLRGAPPSTLRPSSNARWGYTALGRVNPTPGPSRLESTDLLSPPQLLQVAIVCAGHNSSRDVVTLVKSLLFYRYSQECPFPPWKEAVRIP